MKVDGNKIVLMVLRQGRPISTYPTVVNAARMWVQAGWMVDIVTQAAPDVPNLFGSFVHFKHKNFWLQMMQLLSIVNRIRPAVVISYEPIDAELCSVLPHLHNARFIYHNIEIRYPGKRYFYIHNFLECHYYRHCETVICQDPLRFRELKKLLGEARNDVREYFVPNTYMREEVSLNRRFWHSRFKLIPTQKIILYTGAIERKKLPEEVIQRLLCVMPNNWSLALWGWSIKGYGEYLQERYKSQTEIRRLMLLMETVPEEQYRNIVASADAGLIWYATTVYEDANEYNIGLSSGKFWRFVTLGIPVLAINRPGLGDFIRKNQLGVIVESHNDINSEIFSSIENISELDGVVFYDDAYSEVLFTK